MTVEQLREQGYTVRFFHKRISEADLALLNDIPKSRLKRDAPGAPVSRRELKKSGAPIAPRGGYTLAQILREGEVVAEGETWCNPRMDNYNMQIGRQVALGRALKKMTMAEVH